MNSAFVGYEELGRSWRVLSTSADNRHNTLLDLTNSSIPTQPHSLIPNYIIHWLIFARFYSFSVTWYQIAGRVLADLSSGAPWVKSTHSTKFGTHATVHRLRPSIRTTGIPMFTLTLSSYLGAHAKRKLIAHQCCD